MRSQNTAFPRQQYQDPIFRFFPYIFGAAFGLPGVIMLIAAIVMGINGQKFAKFAVKATGTVVGLHQNVSRGKNGTSVTYAPVITYTASDGAKRTFTSSVSSSPPGFSEGQQVTILYDPAPPYKAEVDNFFTLHFGTLILGFLGVVFTGVGGGLFFAIGRAAR